MAGNPAPSAAKNSNGILIQRLQTVEIHRVAALLKYDHHSM
jgi:hypothetical protein